MYMIISNTKQGEGHTDSEPSSLGWDSNLCPHWFSARALPTELQEATQLAGLQIPGKYVVHVHECIHVAGNDNNVQVQ